MPDTITGTREVRENAATTIHRTYDGGHAPITICGTPLRHLVPDPRTFRGTNTRTLTECPTCFTSTFAPGDLVTVADPGDSRLRNPTDWTEGEVYVYVGQRPFDNSHSTLLVRDGWVLADYTREPLPEVVTTARLVEHHPRLQAWNVPTDRLRHAPTNAAVGGRRARARQRLVDARTTVTVAEPVNVVEIDEPVVYQCHAGHGGGSRVHHHSRDVALGTPWDHHNVNHVTRIYTGGIGSDAPSGKERHCAPDGTQYRFAVTGFTTTEAPPTTEREATPVPTTTLPAVGTDLYPMGARTLRELPPGTVLTVHSRERGELRGGSIHFGCKEFTHGDLARAHAVVTYGRRITASCDVTVGTGGDYLTIAGQQISLGELSDYANSVIVKEVGAVVTTNALVMEHGFYGCAVHHGEVIFVGNGHLGGGTWPVVGKVSQQPGNPVLNGIVGVREGLTSAHFVNCTPMAGATNAHTMNLNRERKWALVPATPAQVGRVQLPLAYHTARRVPTATTASAVITECTEAGTPVDLPF